MSNNDKHLKEEFCSSCLVMPLALMGTGAVAAGNVVPNKHKKWKKGLLLSGIITLIGLFVLLAYYFFNRKKCNGTCSL